MSDERIVTTLEARPADAFQRVLKQQLEGEAEWAYASGEAAAAVEDQRRRQVAALFDGAEVVDLVGHSTPIHRYLKLGDWVLDPGEAERLAAYMPPSVRTVRLIGCSTAGTEQGRAAAKALAQSGRLAYGTVQKVYTTHFDHKGVRRGRGAPGLREFRPDGAASPPARPPAPSTTRTYAPGLAPRRARLAVPRPVVTVARLAWWFAATPVAIFFWLLRRPFLARRLPHQQILWLLSPRSAPMPGLLTEPLLTFEVASRGKTWTLEILFDFEYARFYASADPAAKRERVYKIRGFGRVAKTLLEKYLELAPSGVTPTGRHPEADERGGPGAGQPAAGRPTPGR